MKEKTISVFVVIIIFIFVGYLLHLGVDMSYFTTELAVGLIFLAIPILWWGFRSDIERWVKKRSDASIGSDVVIPNFEHVEVRIFYPPKRRWEKTRVLEKHWWEIRKQSPSRQKLALVKDLRKAYYVGTYAWNLILKGKIEWFHEEDQDIEDWCKKEGYKLVKENASKDNLLEPFFEAEIIDKKTEYRQGETVFFRTHYRGDLINGFFDNQITPLSGEILPNGRPSYWSWAPDTLEDGYPNTKGKLNGYVNQQSNWDWQMPQDAPVGKYSIVMGVINHLDVDARPRIAHKEETIAVIPCEITASTTKIEKAPTAIEIFDEGQSFVKCKIDVLSAKEEKRMSILKRLNKPIQISEPITADLEQTEELETGDISFRGKKEKLKQLIELGRDKDWSHGWKCEALTESSEDDSELNEEAIIKALKYLPRHWRSCKKHIRDLTLNDFYEEDDQFLLHINRICCALDKNKVPDEIILLLRGIFSEMTMFYSDLSDMREQTSHKPVVWLGGNPIPALVAEGEKLCKNLTMVIPSVQKSFVERKKGVNHS